MKQKNTWLISLILSAICAVSLPLKAADQPMLTTLNPLGIPPGIDLIPLAPRLDTLQGKTIYFVDDGFVGGDVLLNEMMQWFATSHPEVNTVFRKKGGGGFAAEDPELWAEMKEKADAVIMATGH
jgi:hypothetical protein